MAKSLGIALADENCSTQDIFFSDYPTKELNIVIGKSGILKRGCLLGKKTADGKYYAWKDNATDGTDVLEGILAEDVDATALDEKGIMYIGGEFAKSALSAAASVVIPTGSFKSGMITIKGTY